MFVSIAEGDNLRVIWANDAGRLESRLLRGCKYSTHAEYIGIPFISLGEVCLLITSTEGDGMADVFRPGGADNMANIYFHPSDPPHVSRLPDGDEIVSHMYSRFSDTRYITMAIFRIRGSDKTCAPIASIIDDGDWAISGYDRLLYAYLPSKGRVITRPSTHTDLNRYSDVISTIAPYIITCGNVTASVQRIFDTVGDRMLISAHVYSGCHEYPLPYYIADYSFSSKTLTILDVDNLRRRNACYAAENIVMTMMLTGANTVVRKMINLSDRSEYILTDPV